MVLRKVDRETNHHDEMVQHAVAPQGNPVLFIYKNGKTEINLRMKDNDADKKIYVLI